jgi:uncharacterized protein YeaO (DUF488 family)
MIVVKRAYEPPAPQDGLRVLVERLWPRGLSKQRARIDLWLKDIAPSTELRKWFAHDPTRWGEFQRRYRGELREKRHLIKLLRKPSREGRVTLVYAARDEAHNSALVLKRLLTGHPAEQTRAPQPAGPRPRRVVARERALSRRSLRH